MKKFFGSQKLFLVLIAAALGCGEIWQARADAFAFAENMITDFDIASPLGSIVDVIGSRNTINTAQYGGSFDSTQDPETIPTSSDALEAVAGPGPFPGENDFTPLINQGGFSGARSDSLTSGGDPFTGDGGSGTSLVENVAEAELPDSAVDLSAASSGSNIANASYVFSVMIPTSVTFSFNDAINLDASTSVTGQSAIASVANVFEIDDASGGQVFLFTPTTCGTGNLQGSAGSTSGVPANNSISASCSVSGTSPVLAPGVYQVSLRSTSQADISSPAAMPEPAPSLLFGLGLGVLVVLARKFQRA